MLGWSSLRTMTAVQAENPPSNPSRLRLEYDKSTNPKSSINQMYLEYDPTLKSP